MHIHILGICGTFMGSLALLARELGHEVTGQDQQVYPPMSTQLQSTGIKLIEGFDPSALNPAPDLVLIGNALSRGNAAVEYVLDQGINYQSGPQWLAEAVLHQRWVLAVSGTHGKTTTTAMLLWLLESAGMAPGYLVGGVPLDFPVSARLGQSDFFVIEADEYDTAFFDKRSKFVHYRPRTLVLNNLEFDHADIFDNVEAIERQFHHLVRTVPGSGLLIRPALDTHLDRALEKGCWTPVQNTSLGGEDPDAHWQAQLMAGDGSAFNVLHKGNCVGRVEWRMTGLHNVRNALAALAAAHHVGVLPEQSVAALAAFGGVKRRMELLADIGGVKVYDDFAHHPTAIATTLEGLRKQVGSAPIHVVLEPRSNTMRLGLHRDSLLPALAQADRVFWGNLEHLDWVGPLAAEAGVSHQVAGSVEQLVELLCDAAGEPCHLVIMSNGGFGGLPGKLVTALEDRHAQA